MRRIVVAVVLSVVLLAGCGIVPSTGGRMPEVGTTSQNEALPANLSPAAVADLHSEGDIVIVDVRQDWEYEQVRVPGSLLIPLDALLERKDEVPTDQTVVLLCRSGNRSSQALGLLSDEGFDNVHNLVGGITAWEQQGHPVER
jgi:rhodanese-related sulfurtransferase